MGQGGSLHPRAVPGTVLSEGTAARLAAAALQSLSKRACSGAGTGHMPGRS